MLQYAENLFSKKMTVKNVAKKYLIYIYIFFSSSPPLLVKLAVMLFCKFCKINFMFPWQLAGYNNFQCNLGWITRTVIGTHSTLLLLEDFCFCITKKRKRLIHQLLWCIPWLVHIGVCLTWRLCGRRSRLIVSGSSLLCDCCAVKLLRAL